jgi:hypothetical protein
MTRRLRKSVYLRRNSRLELLAKGSDVPEWAEGQIPDYLVEEGDDQSPSDTEDPERPPLKGPGSGRTAWADYATSQGLEVTDDMTKADIIDALD